MQHSPEKTHKCNYCEKMFHGRTTWRTTCTHDPNKEGVQVKVRQELQHQAGLQRHLAASGHGEASPARCACRRSRAPRCAAGAPEVARGQVGGRREGEEAPVTEHCDAASTALRTSRRHMVVHTGKEGLPLQYTLRSEFGRKDHLTRHMKKSHNQELLKVKTEPVDFLDPSPRVWCHQTSSSRWCRCPPAELLSKPFPSHAAAKPLQHSVPVCTELRALPMITTLPLGMTCPIDMDAVHPPPPFLQVPVQFYLIRHLYSRKRTALEGDWATWWSCRGGVPSSSQDSPASSSNWDLDIAWVPGGQHGDLSCPKAPSPSVTP